jgi:leucyl/phenylalanyl-tRNA--protein transferase
MQYGPVFLNERLWFPPVEAADEDGLLAVGGDLSTERLLLAYRNGIFPWYDGPIPLWWNPDPRLVLFPDRLKISKSMKQVLKKGQFTFSKNQRFREVMHHCGATYRKGQSGSTWVTVELINAYEKLHKLGFAHSFEAWENGVLAGGLYGILLGKVFFGESMFTHVNNASKAAFIKAVGQLKQEGIQLIDCQVETAHLMSLGAELITRKEFIGMLEKCVPPVTTLEGE